MAKGTDFQLVKAPDGFYFARKLKSGMPANDARRITDEEVIAMFEDLLRRNKAETGRSVMTIFSKRVPVLMAKLYPDIRETGVLPKPQLTPLQIQMLRQQQLMRQRPFNSGTPAPSAAQAQMQQARKAKMPPLQVGKFGEPQS